MQSDRPGPPLLGPRTAAALTLWATALVALHLAVRELGLRLVP